MDQCKPLPPSESITLALCDAILRVVWEFLICRGPRSGKWGGEGGGAGG